jgi:hypothetical protein
MDQHEKSYNYITHRKKKDSEREREERKEREGE